MLKVSKIPDYVAKMTPLDSKSLREIYQQLDALGYSLEPFTPEDENPLYDIFRDVVDSGWQFPYESSSLQEFHRQFFAPQAHVFVCHTAERKVVGGFYIKPNCSGGPGLVANAAYMVRNTHRNKGIGKLLIKASLHLAKGFGFQSMQFNRVLSQNHVAIAMYQKLGFKIIDTIPEAFRSPDGVWQEGYRMARSLEDCKSL